MTIVVIIVTVMVIGDDDDVFNVQANIPPSPHHLTIIIISVGYPVVQARGAGDQVWATRSHH
jgi:hypothetical protein